MDNPCRNCINQWLTISGRRVKSCKDKCVLWHVYKQILDKEIEKEVKTVFK